MQHGFAGRSRSRLAAVVTLVVMSVGGTPAIVSAAPTSPLWVGRYDGPASRLDAATAVAVSPNGSEVFVTGRSRGPGNGYDYATLAYQASTGDVLWVRRHGQRDVYDRATALGVSPDGSTVFVTGTGGRTTGNTSITVAYDASTGNQLWAMRYTGLHSAGARALAVGPDGSAVFVTGFTGGATRRVDYATVAYDASTGIELWATRHDGGTHGSDYASAIGVSPDGSEVFVTGDSIGSTSGYDYGTVAYDAATGDQLWSRRYDGPASSGDEVFALGVSPDGSEVFVTGNSPGSTIGEDYATVAYDASTGDRIWVKRFTGRTSAGYVDSARALQVSPDGSEVFVTGGTTGASGSYDYTTVTYDASTGEKLWAKRYDGPRHGYDAAAAVEVSPDGSAVIVTGTSSGPGSGYDYATVAYDASTGTPLWVERYDGAQHGRDYASALAVNPVGSEVFVTGTSNGATNYDYATVAYAVT
jgi:outer membrane protein assembly factor BamB